MIKIYDFILTVLGPFIRWWGKFHFPFTRKKVTGKHYYAWRDQIKIGMVLLTKTSGEFSNYINPNKLKHAGIYVGEIYDDGIFYVLEAVGKGVILTDLVSFLTSKDIVVGCMPTFIRDDGKFELEVQDAALRYLGLPYDYMFQKDGKAFYCFELAAMCLKSAYPELQLKCKEVVKKKFAYSYETFLDEDFFNTVFDSREI